VIPCSRYRANCRHGQALDNGKGRVTVLGEQAPCGRRCPVSSCDRDRIGGRASNNGGPPVALRGHRKSNIWTPTLPQTGRLKAPVNQSGSRPKGEQTPVG
jgi:hypothetical protein